MSNLFCVDAFTARAGAGNPAGVCLLSASQDPAWMQMVAQEMSLPETAFLYQERDGFQLRWFTPEVEVDLCGHATLAAAHILWQEEYLKPAEPARFFLQKAALSLL
jgi:PhzF family phenazine biosynthesis protein